MNHCAHGEEGMITSSKERVPCQRSGCMRSHFPSRLLGAQSGFPPAWHRIELTQQLADNTGRGKQIDLPRPNRQEVSGDEPQPSVSSPLPFCFFLFLINTVQLSH